MLLEVQVGEGDCIKIGRQSFYSKVEMEAFVINHIPSGSWECFVDAVALLDTLKGTLTTDTEAAQTAYNAQRTKYKSERELTIFNSFCHITPVSLATNSQTSLVSSLVPARASKCLGIIKSERTGKK